MWKKLAGWLMGKEDELHERLTRTVIMLGGVVTAAGLLEMVLLRGVTSMLIVVILTVALLVGSVLFVALKFRKYEQAAILLGLVIIILLFPLTFIYGGALDGGATVWMTLGILYIFIMFSGKRLFYFLILALVMYGGTYLATYLKPEMVTPMSSRTMSYIDSFFAVFLIGSVGGIILKAHMNVFAEEHKINLAQKEELAKSRDTRNVLFANMSHEIRTPINAIIGLNEMILRENPGGEIGTYAKDIQAASKMLLNQVNDILDLSKMEMERMEVVPTRYQTKELFTELTELTRVQLEKKNLDMILDIDEKLPSVLIGDEKRLKQVLLNLLDNAVKYTQNGSVTLAAEAEENRDGYVGLKISVADTGIGIRKEDIEHIYDAFRRVDEKKNTNILGSGLGLAITKQLVELMGGEISVDSIYTKGSTFTVKLRQKVADATFIGDINIKAEETAAGEAYKPSFEAPEARILVVDDNRMNSMVATRLLSFTKVQVDVANSGMECLELTKRKYYHVILLDYMMPGMDGLETFQELREQENGLCRDSAVIALTGNSQSGAKQMYLDMSFDGYLEKPIQGKMLEAEILKFLPEDIIENRRDTDGVSGQFGRVQKQSRRKRKKIYVTTDCASDIPQDLLEKYDIKLMYLYIKTPNGRFADTREIDIDSLSQYVSDESSSAYADSVTVEEFEQFFAETLTEADQIIHISLASRAGKSYDIAMTAAKSFDHVHIIDSGQISGGQALVTLHAAMLAMEGKSAKEIIKEVESGLGNIHTRVIMAGAEIFHQNGRARSATVKICRFLNLHPYMAMLQKRAVLIALLGGSMESAWRQGIRLHLRRKRKISRGICFVTHVGCSVKQQEWIKKEILKCIPFERVVMQKASFTNACNTGKNAIGIAYYTFPK